jgi:chorismate mutase
MAPIETPIMADATRTPTKPPPTLADLRREIDRIDEAMHRLLMERGEIIDTLIATKKTAESGSAFRPAREADMMRRLVERHRGILPLDTAESILRVIIATFTYVQAPFSVHADLSPGEAAMRDCARFHFGFTVPFVSHLGAAGVVAAVAASRGDIGLVPAANAPNAWWSALEGSDAPKIIARLPFVERADHPAGLPVFGIARPNPDAIVPDVETWSVRVAGWGPAASRALDFADIVAVPDRAFDGAALLASVPKGGIGRLTDALVEAGASVRGKALVGSHATRYTVTAEGPVPTGP